MFQWRIPQAACVLSVCLCVALAYEDDIEVNYADPFYNEITEGDPEPTTPSPVSCNSPDLTKWDKLFSMMENSQMRENMLLQYVDDIMKVEIGSLRNEMLRFVVQYGGSCGAAVETAGRQLSMQLEDRLKATLDRLKTRDHFPAADSASSRSSGNLESTLQQLLAATRAQASRLAKLEASCLSGSNAKTGFQLPGHVEQEVTSRGATLDGLLATLQDIRGELKEVMRSSRQRSLPAGCEMALLFPMHSRRIYTSVIPEAPFSLSAFTVCMWAKPTAVNNKTVLFSYGNHRNPYEIQLLLGQASALFTVGGEAHLVEAPGVVSPGQWIHLCGAWSSDQGLATLWVNGKKVTSTPGVAEGHVVPAGGSLQLGQEKNGCCPTSQSGFEAGFDPKLAFAGKMAGVNLWDRVLAEDEISQMASWDGHGCTQRGSLVAWGLTEMVPHGGAQFIF
ncbi:unnamed protein product [Ophioblennius macclurei]